jgi:hypothetical protein
MFASSAAWLELVMWRSRLMKINNLLPGYADPTNLGKRADAMETRTSSASQTTTPGIAPSNAAVARDILVQYDVKHMTPNQFSQMAQRLYDAGAISRQDYQDLAKIRTDLDAAGVDPDEASDLLRFYQDKIQTVSQSVKATANLTQAGQLNPLTQRLDWLEKFAVVQSQPETVGLSTLA